ncbi:MAG: tetratricopeptide repeat protein, partial [Methylocystaceae bacterium]|nr:tetratricopeptide repeat protein [Methylocystaceae bacterium]
MVEAVASYDRALAINPSYVEAWANRGNALLALKRLEEALLSYDRAISLDPVYAEGFYNRSIALMQLGRIAESLANCDQAIAINPNYAEAYANRSVALVDLKRPSEALASCDLAIAHRPNYAEAHYNRGVALKELNCLAEAVRSFDRAIAVQANYPEAYFNKAISLLLAGDLNGAWDLYEWRWKQANVPKINVAGLKPLWHSDEDISNKTILLCAEQGFGDIIQFCRYALLVQQLGGRVILEVPSALMRLLAELKGVDFLVKKGDPLPHFDYYCPLLSLPKAFKTQLHTIPSPRPYLFAVQEKREEWIKKLGKKTKLRVGLVWSGAAKNTNDHNRSIPLRQLLPYLPAEHEYYCLQKEVRTGDESDLA